MELSMDISLSRPGFMDCAILWSPRCNPTGDLHLSKKSKPTHTNKTPLASRMITGGVECKRKDGLTMTLASQSHGVGVIGQTLSRSITGNPTTPFATHPWRTLTSAAENLRTGAECDRFLLTLPFRLPRRATGSPTPNNLLWFFPMVCVVCVHTHTLTRSLTHSLSHTQRERERESVCVCE